MPGMQSRSASAQLPHPPHADLVHALQDGTIQYEVKLTGCLSTNGLSMGEGPEPTHGTLLAPGLNAQVHQHFFCARLDMAVDDPSGGANLTVTEVSAGPPGGKVTLATAIACLSLSCLSWPVRWKSNVRPVLARLQSGYHHAKLI